MLGMIGCAASTGGLWGRSGTSFSTSMLAAPPGGSLKWSLFFLCWLSEPSEPYAFPHQHVNLLSIAFAVLRNLFLGFPSASKPESPTLPWFFEFSYSSDTSLPSFPLELSLLSPRLYYPLVDFMCFIYASCSWANVRLVEELLGLSVFTYWVC